MAVRTAEAERRLRRAYAAREVGWFEQEITPVGMTAQIDLTLTDEYPMAQAFVIISAVQNRPLQP